MQHLLDFLACLEEESITYDLKHVRSETVMVLIQVPGEHWEVEFFADGHTEIEIYRSIDGVISGTEAKQALERLFTMDTRWENIPLPQRQVVPQTDGAHTAVYTDGYGPAVLFVNGWALSRRYWQPAISQLRGDYACVTFDARGVGESRPMAAGRAGRTGRLAVDIGAIAGAVAPDAPLHLVAHSNGCLSAARFAGAYPERVASLTIINAGTFPFEPFQVAALQAFTRLSVRVRGFTATPAGRWYMMRFVTTQPVPEGYGRILADDFAATEAPAALEAALASLNRDDLARYSADIAAVCDAGKPILLMVGQGDRTIPPAGMRTLHAETPGSTLVTFAPCGHFPMLEQVPAFVATLRAHLGGTLKRGGELRVP